jgi:sugar lactone lactonase YvrE
VEVIEPQVERIGDTEDSIGETPVWRAEEGALYWIDCDGPPRLQRWQADSGETASWTMPERIGGFVFKAGGYAVHRAVRLRFCQRIAEAASRLAAG